MLLFFCAHIIRLIIGFIVIVFVVVIVMIEIKTFLSMLVRIPFSAIHASTHGAVRTVIAKVAAQLGFSFLPPRQSALKSLITHKCLYFAACQYVALVNGPGEIELVHIDAAGKSNVGLALREHSLIQVDPD